MPPPTLDKNRAFDPTALAYDLSVMDPQGRVLHLPRAGLTIEEAPGELATVMRCRLADVMTSEGLMWMLVPPGTRYYISIAQRGPVGPSLRSPVSSEGRAWDATQGGTVGGIISGTDELTRGIIHKISRSADSAEIEIEGSDNLHTLLEHDIDLAVAADTPVRDVLNELFGKWGATLGQFDGPDVNMPATTWRGERAAKVIDEILAQGPMQGAGQFLLRASGDQFDIVGAGKNEPTYWLRPGSGAGVSSYTVDISKMVANVMVRTEVVNPEGKELPPVITEVSAEGASDYGGADRILVRKQKSTPEISALEAKAELAKSGFPDMSFEHVTMDVPYLHKFDRLRITDRLLDGYFIVTGVSHDASQQQMHVRLMTPEDFERQGLLITYETQLDRLKGEEKKKDSTSKKVPPPPGGVSHDDFNRGAPGFEQATDWTCSAASTAMTLNMCWIDATEQWVVGELGAGINSSVGLTDASGTQIQRVLRNQGVTSSTLALSGSQFDQALSIFSTAVGQMGGQGWNHWTAVRGTSGDTLQLMNPAPGYKGVGQTMTRADFQRLGSWNLVYVVEPPPGRTR